MPVESLIDQLRRSKSCKVLPTQGIPDVDMPIPADVEGFYRLCGGAILYEGADYSIEIVPPCDFLRANPIIVGEDCSNDRSYDWFTIARTESDYLTIDLNPARFGRCYDSFRDCHGIAGNCQVVATGFESLLKQLIDSHGEYWYWLKPGFRNLGDAYES